MDSSFPIPNFETHRRGFYFEDPPHAGRSCLASLREQPFVVSAVASLRPRLGRLLVSNRWAALTSTGPEARAPLPPPLHALIIAD